MGSLIRWQPFHELTSIQERMNRLFEDFFGRTPLALGTEEPLGTWGFAPPADIYEDAHKLVFKVEIPGIEEKDLRVEIEGNMLTVSGERKSEQEVKEEHFRRKERHYGAFSRSFTLPNTVDPSKIEANYVNGVLAIELPKRAEAKPKQIKINVTKTLKAA